MSIEIPSLVNYTATQADISEKGVMYIVKMGNGKLLKITESAKLIMEEIDGIRGYEEITDVVRRKYGFDISIEDIKEFITTELGSKGMVKGIESDPKAFTNSKIWVHFRLFGDETFEKLGPKLAFLFKKPVVIATLVLSMALFLYSVRSFSIINRIPVKTSGKSWLFLMFLIMFSLFVHELGHIAACHNFGAKSRGGGIGFYMFIPVLYVDLSEIWVLPKIQRAIVDLSGIYYQLIFFVLLSPMIFINNLFFNFNNYRSFAAFILANIFLDLNPLLRMDGYWTLSDLTGIVNIHKRTRDNIVNIIKKIFRPSKYNPRLNFELTPVAKKIFYFWSFGYFIVSILALVYGSYRLTVSLSNGFGKVDIGIIIVLALIILQSIIPKSKKQ